MNAQRTHGDNAHRTPRHPFDKHGPEYRERFEEISDEMHAGCPVAWTEAHGGHWVVSGDQELFTVARAADHLSNDRDVTGEGSGYSGVTIPTNDHEGRFRGGFLEMDPPEQRHYRQALNPYLSPAAVARWIPLVDEVVRASIDEHIESGRIDFVDHLANVVPAVMTLAMMGIPLKKWTIYCEPIHARVYTPIDSPDMERVNQLSVEMSRDLARQLHQIRAEPRPGLIDALARADINGKSAPDHEIIGSLALLVGGGFDTTTALTAHALEWLSEHPEERDRLSRERDTLLDTATEEFLRFYTPAVGDGRTVTDDCEMAGTSFKEGERVWLSWAVANRDPKAFPNPHEIDLARKQNRHYSFGLGIHRCIGSNVARTLFKRMLVQVLDRMPDFAIDPAGTVHYDNVGIINGMRHLPATFTPGPRLGAGLDETLERLQRTCDEQRLAEPVTVRKERARIEG